MWDGGEDSVPHAREREHALLDAARIDVETAADDHVAESPGDPKHSVAIEPAAVS